MGFHRTIISKERTMRHLMSETLSNLYNSESMIFTDDFSSFVRDLFLQNKSEQEIINILKSTKEENKNEKH